MDFVVKRYSPKDKNSWDEFVGRAKNTTFMFLRDYIDYHGDRFEDASLVVSDARGAIRALLPATRSGGEVISHAGLTYAGFAIDSEMTLANMLRVFDAAITHLRDEGAELFLYKTVPHIYHRNAAEEDLHALLVNGAELVRRDILSVVDYGAESEWEPRLRYRLRKGAKATRAGLEVRETDDWRAFWQLLTSTLASRHGVDPVHSLDEIELLAGRFPEHIRLFGAYRGASLEAGVVVYLTHRVCHAQYSANSEEGRRQRALDLLFAHVISMYSEQVQYFDFGISSEDGGRVMNEGLLEFKERFGARAVAHDFYLLSLARA